ncbi:MAG: hypothetical protein ACI8RD_010507 [Bacillariaceae sp.]|jgi:hypothetical protein
MKSINHHLCCYQYATIQYPITSLCRREHYSPEVKTQQQNETKYYIFKEIHTQSPGSENTKRKIDKRELSTWNIKNNETHPARKVFFFFRLILAVNVL